MIDILIHVALCFIYCWLGLRYTRSNSYIFLSVIFVAIMVEYEQKFQIWYNELTWAEYFYKHASTDLIADFIGMGLALLTRIKKIRERNNHG